MHGQRRDEYKARLRDDAIAAKLATKAEQWHLLSAELIKRRKATAAEEEQAKDEQQPTGSDNAKTLAETLKLIDKLLSVNPDPIYLWNHRREVLLSVLHSHASSDKGDNNDVDEANTKCKDFIQKEQILTQTALENNPKAYGAWFHRKWSIRQYILILSSSSSSSSTSTATVAATCRKLLEGELSLCAEFLKLDERNFHCWNYRRFIVSTLAHVLIVSAPNCYDDDVMKLNLGNLNGGWNFLRLDDDNDDMMIGPQLTSSPTTSPSLPPSIDITCVQDLLENEWKFTTEKIHQNFSNGSAFHYRSKLLPLLLHFDSTSVSSAARSKSEWVRDELELIRNAIFTEPDDQTSWWYFRFILAWANPLSPFSKSSPLTNEQEVHVQEYQQMLHDEWMSINELVEAEDNKSKWGLLGLYMIALIFIELEQRSGISGSIAYAGEDWLELAKSYLGDLKVLDPDRKNRYQKMEQELA